MKQLFAPYEIAFALKQKKFNENCFAWYQQALYRNSKKLATPEIKLEMGFAINSQDWLKGKHCSAPLYQQVIDWLRLEPRFIQILEQPETFTDKEPMYVVKQRGAYATGKMPLNNAIEEALKQVE